MSKLFYIHGVMNSSKSAQLIMTAHNYKVQGRQVLVLKSSKDNRWSEDSVESRAVGSVPCIGYSPEDNLEDLIGESNPEVILVDECQFLSKEQVVALSQLVDDKGIIVMCYGLKNSYIDGELFEGSKALLYYADSIQETKTVCVYCKRKATMNLLLRDNVPVYTGDQIVLGDVVESEIKYVPVCRYHYRKGKKKT